MAAVGRMIVGLVLLGIALVVGSVVMVSCKLYFHDWGPTEGMPVDKGQVLTRDLRYGMSDAEIVAAVELENATVLEVRQAPDSTTVLVSFLTDVQALECREVVLSRDWGSSYEEVDCPVR